MTRNSPRTLEDTAKLPIFAANRQKEQCRAHLTMKQKALFIQVLKRDNRFSIDSNSKRIVVRGRQSHTTQISKQAASTCNLTKRQPLHPIFQFKDLRTMKIFRLMSLSLLLLNNVSKMILAATTDTTNEYVMVGVSGGLQEGFPEHFRMDYHSGMDDEVPAVFLGRALVRGYKSYLDVMQVTWRQYTPEPEQPLINPNVIPTGCWHHANEYWIYLVDTRHFATILMNEPRFLSIAADLGLVDLIAEETGPLVKYIAEHEIQRQNKTDASQVAFPIVTGAWYNPSSHVPAPVLYTKDDGTQVTNFPQSLASWAGVIDPTTECATRSDDGDEAFEFLATGDASKFFFDSIRNAIRHAEENPRSLEQAMADGPPMKCEKKARFGVSADMARINYPFTPQDFEAMIEKGGYRIDFSGQRVYQTKDSRM